jgi:hypothetical protein
MNVFGILNCKKPVVTLAKINMDFGASLKFCVYL